MRKLLVIILTISNLSISYGQSYNFEQGVKAYNESEFDKSLDYLGREIKDNPKNGLAYYYRACIYKYREQFSSALSDISNAIKAISPKEKKLLAGAYRLRGDIYVQIENYDKTFDDYAKAVKLTPDDPEVYIDRAQIYFDLLKFAESDLDYKQALKIDESLVMPYAGLARNSINQKKFAEAEKILNQLIKLSPDYSAGFKFRAICYYEQNRFDDAINDIFNAYLLDQSEKGLRSMFISYAEKNYSLALSKVNAQIASQPEKDLWYFIRAQLYDGKNEYHAAITDYTKVMELADISFRFNLLSYRASCYVDAGLYAQGIADYSEAISIDSTYAYSYGYRGDAKRLMGDYQAAKEDFSKAISIEPREAWFYYRRGWIEEEFLNDNTSGLADYSEGIAINKDYAYLYLHRGRLYDVKLKNPVKAKEDYNSVLALDTVVNQGGNCRQYALMHLGRNEEAIAWINKIIAQYPTDGNYYDAACLYSLLNKPDESIANLKLAFEKGYRGFQHARKDDDLDNVRKLPAFISLFNEWQKQFDDAAKADAVKGNELESAVSETVSIPMKSKGSGTYEVPCKINDLGLNLIFDTGASDISISQTEVQFMLKNGYLSSNDFTGTQQYMDANGDIEVGTTLIFRKVDFGGMILKNVKATVVHNKNAPLLFGQSALSKYGKIVIDNEKRSITITSKSQK